jgi:predicted Zn-dependent peptidase
MTIRRDTTQAQLCLGVPGLPRDHPEAWTLEVLNAILGDGMSSRLFQSVREEKGLAYDVSSYIIDYADAGALIVSAGVDPGKISPTVAATLVELARLRDEPVPAEELARSKAYLGGRLELRLEETRHVASWLGGQEALHDKVLTPDEALAELQSVTVGRLHELARSLFRDEALRLAVVAPPRRGRKLETLLRLPGGAA